MSASALETLPSQPSWQDPGHIESLLREGYDDRLFFHVWEHARSARDEARELGAWCAYEDYAADPDNRDGGVNFYVLEWAALGHDYGYYAWTFLPDEDKLRWPSREKYAAAEVRRIMESVEAPEDVISQVEASIWSTELKVPCASRESRVMRQADLANVGKVQDVRNLGNFLWSTLQLYREDRLLKGKSANLFIPHEFIAYCMKSHAVLATYNEEDVSLGDFDRTPEGRSLFCSYAEQAISFLEKPKRVRELAKSVGFTLLRDRRTKKLG